MSVESNFGADPRCPRDPLENHYTFKQIAEKWGCDDETVRQEFIDEDGVLILGKQTRNDGTRPSHLLCLAMREECLTESDRDQLKTLGWRVARVQHAGDEWL